MRKLTGAVVFFFLCCLIHGNAQEFITNPEVAPEMVALLRDRALFSDFSLFANKKNTPSVTLGLKLNEKHLQNARATGDKTQLATAANNLGWIYSRKGDSEKGLASFRLAAQTFGEQGNRYGEALVRAEMGYVLAQKKNHDGALEYLDKSLALAPASEVRLLALVNYLKALSLAGQNRHPETITAFGLALQSYESLSNPAMSGRTRIKLAEEYISTGDDAQARTVLNVAVKQLNKTKDKFDLSTAYSYLGIISYLNNDFEKALSWFNQSLQAASRVSVLKLVRDTYMKLLSSSDVRNDESRRVYFNKLYYQYRDSIQQMDERVNNVGNVVQKTRDEQNSFSALLSRNKEPYSTQDKPQIEFSKKLNEAELQRLKAEEALALLNKEKAQNEGEVHERETRIVQLQKEMAEQDLALSQKELKASRQKQLINMLLVSSLAVVVITLVLLSRYRQKKRSHEEVKEAFRELSATHEQLKVMQDQLVHSEKMASLGQLTAGIAHEIQNPLNFVNNFSEVNTELLNELEATSSGEDRKMIISSLRQNLLKVSHHGKRADSIIKGMLLHSRNGSHEKQLSDLNLMADEFIQLAYHGMRTKSLGFTCEIETLLDPGLPKASVVPQDFSRVLLNLFSNAFYAVAEKKKSSAAGSGYMPKVTVATSFDEHSLQISVADNGNGIPSSVVDKIFNPFFTTKPPGYGTGLGLSISFDIVTKGHNGELKVESKEGECTRFLILLPLNT